MRSRGGAMMRVEAGGAAEVEGSEGSEFSRPG